MCMKDAEDKVGKRGYDTARMNCVNNYKSELKKQVPNLNQIYDGYQRNFQAHDGSLVKSDFGKINKQDAKYMAEIQEQQDLINTNKNF